LMESLQKATRDCIGKGKGVTIWGFYKKGRPKLTRKITHKEKELRLKMKGVRPRMKDADIKKGTKRSIRKERGSCPQCGPRERPESMVNKRIIKHA